MDRSDWPLAVGDVVYSEAGTPMKFIDYPTGGPLFELPDGRMRQYESDEAETLL